MEPTDDELKLMYPDRSLEEARVLQQLKTELNASIEDAMKFTDAEPAGLNRWMPEEWSHRPLQTGMEKQHQSWVLATLNFLQALDIPFYNRDQYGNKLRGEKQIPERLKLVAEKYAILAKTASQAESRVASAELKAREAREAREALQRYFGLALEELRSSERDIRDRLVAASELLDHALSDEALKDMPRGFQPKIGTPDDRGITRVTIDARDVVLRLGMHRITHDLEADEKVCPSCLGLGIGRDSVPFRVGERKPNEDVWPYHNSWLRQCPNCYMGKIKVCEHCQSSLPRGRLECQCAAATAVRLAEKAKAEEARRQTLQRLSLGQYDGDMLWADTSDRFIEADAAEDWAEDHENEVFFACKPMNPLLELEASEIIENFQNYVTENANPEDEDDVLEFSAEAEAELASYLKTWTEKHVTARTLWYPDMDVIVEVPRPTDDPPGQSDS